jgi:hypothetical protein
VSEQERKLESENLYVVARTSKHGGHNGYAYLPFAPGDSFQVQIITDINPANVMFYPSVVAPMVTWFGPDQRRSVLALFSKHPKLFERCEIVSLKALAVEKREREYAVFKSRSQVPMHPEPEEKRTYLVIRSGGFKMVALRSDIEVEEISLTDKEFREGAY